MSGLTRFVLDTNAVIALLAGNLAVLQLTDRAEWLGVSVVTCIEFQATSRLTAGDLQLFEAFARRVELVGLDPLDSNLISEVVRIRRLKQLKLPDAVIVATAVVKTAGLITADQDIHRSGLIQCTSF